ncbi:hypothetical protein M5K25_003665 [Dendrobium thyrsiflorum]|uniref:RING-type E3 ubiquitin transferase n=1 Tax=Dendrobium thyrsiflorum TaxID=117978 RepID=A0ABD0VJM7_DENTH
MGTDGVECVSLVDGMEEDEATHTYKHQSFCKNFGSRGIGHGWGMPMPRMPIVISVNELLECPVCTNSMYPPIHQILKLFTAYGFEGFLDGTSIKPSKQLLNADGIINDFIPTDILYCELGDRYFGLTIVAIEDASDCSGELCDTFISKTVVVILWPLQYKISAAFRRLSCLGEISGVIACLSRQESCAQSVSGDTAAVVFVSATPREACTGLQGYLFEKHTSFTDSTETRTVQLKEEVGSDVRLKAPGRSMSWTRVEEEDGSARAIWFRRRQSSGVRRLWLYEVGRLADRRKRPEETSVDFPAVVARTAATFAYGTDSERPARRPHSAETSARSAHLSAPRVTVTQEPHRRISVFERISQPEAPAAKRIVTGGRISVVTANTTTLPTGSPASGNNNVETSSSGGRLTRRQRRKRNAELRAQQQFSTHPSNVPAQELEATIPTQNRFSNLKWKEPESLSARVYRVLRTVKEKGLTKKRFQRPLIADVRRTPPRERLSFARVERRERRNNPLGEYRGVTPELHIRGSTTERSRWKGKQVWRPRPRRDDERKEREIDLGVTSGAASRRSASTNKQRQKWVQKKTHDDICPDGRHLGEFSKGSRRSLTPPKEESNFDRSPRVEEILLPNQEPEIQWRRRSEIRMLEEEEEDIQDEDEEEMEDAINMEVVYMLRHTNINDEAYYDEGEDDEDRQPPIRRVYRRQREAGSTADRGDRSQGEQEADEVEENLFDDENATLANIRRQMRRQMRAKDREISQLNEKMTEMMAQMRAMMQMMQRTATASPIADPPADPPNLRIPQVSGVRGARRGEADSAFFSRASMAKQMIYNVDKGKQPMQYEEKPKQVYNPNPQPKLILGGNDKPRNFQGGGERPRQTMGTGDRTFPSLKDKMNKEKEDKKPVQEEQWETAVSKKTTKMLKQLEGVPGVKWKSPTEPVLNLKGLPKVQASSSKQRPSQASSSKPKKVKSSKKKTKLKKPKEKKTITQRVIDSLDEYYQSVRQPIKLADFMSGLKVGETEENGEADSLPTEVCRVISVVSSTSVNEECAKGAAIESCMMEREKKQVGRKKASPTLPKAAIIPKERKHIPHLGSDTEEDVTPAKSRGVRQPSAKRRREVEYVNSDYDYESIFMNTVQCVFSRRIDSLSVSDSVLVVTRVPLRYFKEIIPREVHKVEELTTRYLPPLEKGTEPGSILYSVGIHEEENRDWCYKFVDSEELFPMRLPRMFTARQSECCNGHTLCSTCKAKVNNRCPTCRHELGDIRCLALEKVAECYKLPCKYYSLGCPEIFPYYSKLKHESHCTFRPYNCPYAGSECAVVGDISLLVSHLKNDHKVDMHSGCTFNHRYVKSNPREVDNATWMLTVFNCFGKYFCLHFEAFLLHKAPVYMAFLRYMGDENDARKYCYSLEVGADGRKMIWEGTPRSIRDSHQKVRDSYDGLIIQRNMALLISCGDQTELKLRVTGRIWKELSNPESGVSLPTQHL